MQKQYYGPQLVINLVNKKGYEAPMGAAFSKQIDILNDPQIKYHHFDFHHECSKMKWHRVSLLLDHFHSDLVAQGYVPPPLSRCSHSLPFCKLSPSNPTFVFPFFFLLLCLTDTSGLSWGSQEQGS